MRRADRLFDILQHLRRRDLVRAWELAEVLEVSERTIYRDVAALIASGVPIEGEAGVGYMLRDFDLPPLMFDREEIEALVLGIRIVESWADPGLAASARRALGKIEVVLPPDLRDAIDKMPVDAPGDHWEEPLEIHRRQLRRAIQERRKLSFRYRSKAGAETERTVRPLLMSFYGPVWVLTAWCELRGDFRTFRLDLIRDPHFLDEVFAEEDGKRLDDLMAREAEAR